MHLPPLMMHLPPLVFVFFLDFCFGGGGTIFLCVFLFFLFFFRTAALDFEMGNALLDNILFQFLRLRADPGSICADLGRHRAEGMGWVSHVDLGLG